MDIPSSNQVYVLNIAYPGDVPIYAVHVNVDREYVFTDPRAISSDRAFVERFATKVREQGHFNPDLWEATTMSEMERAVHHDNLWMWEEEEKQAGRW